MILNLCILSNGNEFDCINTRICLIEIETHNFLSNEAYMF